MYITRDEKNALREKLDTPDTNVPRGVLLGVAALVEVQSITEKLVSELPGELGSHWRVLAITERGLVHVDVAPGDSAISGWVRRLADVSSIGLLRVGLANDIGGGGPEWFPAWAVTFSDGFTLPLPLFHVEKPANYVDELTETFVRAVRQSVHM